jgi:hypothetical protein
MPGATPQSCSATIGYPLFVVSARDYPQRWTKPTWLLLTGKVHRLTIVCGTEHLQWYMGPRVRKDDYSFWCGGDCKLRHARLFLYRTSLTNLAMLATTLSHARFKNSVMPSVTPQSCPAPHPSHARLRSGTHFWSVRSVALNSACYTN